MPIPTKPNPRKYTLTMKVTKDTYLEVINEAERLDMPVSRFVSKVFEEKWQSRKNFFAQLGIRT